MGVTYQPQPDITLWELASVLGVLLTAVHAPETLLSLLAEMPPEVRRHFRTD